VLNVLPNMMLLLFFAELSFCFEHCVCSF
jgi:hypothetical protein